MPQRKTEQEVREVVRLHKDGISQNQIHKTLGFDLYSLASPTLFLYTKKISGCARP